MLTLQQALEWLRDNAEQVQAEIDAKEPHAKNVQLFYGFVYRNPRDNAAGGLFIGAVDDYLKAKKAKE